MRTGGAGSRLLGPAGLLGYRMPIAAAPHGPRRRRGRAGAAGGNRGCPRSTLGSCRLRLGPAPRWDMQSHMPGSSAKLVGSCDGGRAREACMGPGAPGEVSPWRRAVEPTLLRVRGPRTWRSYELVLCVDGVELSRLDYASRAADAARYLCDVNSGLAWSGGVKD